jgi:hypothetical protein
MSETFYNPENIEAYITNKMSAGEKYLFENELAKDPLLQNEIDLQKDIVEALKSNRKAQLKDRLNNIEVNINTSTAYTGLKVAASILLAGLISFGAYNYISFNKNQSENTIGANNNIALTNSEKINSSNTRSNEVIIIESTKANKTSIIGNETKKTTTSKNQTGSGITSKEAGPVTPVIIESNNLTPFNAPQVNDRYDEGDGIKTDNKINMPKSDVGNAFGEGSLDNLKVQTIKEKSHNLFYQYYNNKLFLYGDFDSKPYEILELNTIKDKQLYLYFESNYYNLKQNQMDITSLTVIKDKETFSSLEKVRNK